MTWGLSWILALTMLFMQAPALEGNATFYAEPYIGRTMQNGSLYTGAEMTAAVSADRWNELAGAHLLVCVQPELVSNPDELNCSATPNGSGDYEQSYDESMNNLCSYHLAPITDCDGNSRNLHCAIREYNRAQKCVIVEVTDTGAFGNSHLDLSVAAFRALRPYGTPYDNDGALPVRAWQIQ